jgi:hypothetical protein
VFENDGHTNISVTNGTLSFWFQPNWTSVPSGNGPESWARLVEVGTWTSNATHGCWSLYLNPGGTNIYFESQTNGNGAIYLQAPIDWASNDWHQIVVTCSSSNSILYIDGEVVTNGSAVGYWPGVDVQTQDGLCIGSDTRGHLKPRGSSRTCKPVIIPGMVIWLRQAMP